MIAVLRDLNIGTAGLTKQEAEKNNIEVKTCVTEKKILSDLLAYRLYPEDMELKNGLMPCRLQ